jgi:hypothetical protein
MWILRYDIHAMVVAHQCASARVDSRDPMVDSVLIAGHAGTAAAMRGSARENRVPLRPGTGGRRLICSPPSATCAQNDPLCASQGNDSRAGSTAQNGGSRVSSAVGAVTARDGEGGGVCYRMTVKGPSAVEGISK